MPDAIDALFDPDTLELALALIGGLALLLLWWEERRVRVGLFGRYVDPLLPGGDRVENGTFDFEIQNFEDRALPGPIFVHFRCHADSRAVGKNYIDGVWLFAGPAYADIIQEKRTATEIVLRIQGIGALKTIGFRLETAASAVTFWADGQLADKPEWSRSVRRHAKVSRWPVELKVTTGDHSTARRVARSPSWELFLWSALSAAAAYTVVRLGQREEQPWDWPIDLTLLGSIIGMAAVVFWLIRRDAMPVALGYVQRQRLWPETTATNDESAPSAPQPPMAPSPSSPAPLAAHADGRAKASRAAGDGVDAADGAPVTPPSVPT